MDQNDPKLQNILEKLKQFGFEFYGNGESGVPLVKGPNGQVVEVNIAINFVNEQIKKQQESAGGSIENPQMPENIDTKISVERSVESKIETSMEQEKSPEQKSERNDNPGAQAPIIQKKAPQVKLDKSKNKPYGDGFDPQGFNPTDINSTMRFIEKNSKESNKSSNKWLAEQFKKFVAEFDASKK